MVPQNYKLFLKNENKSEKICIFAKFFNSNAIQYGR